jgi:aldehyde dehydrogenase (NAD+)
VETDAPRHLLIDGQLVPPTGGRTFDAENPATALVAGTAPDADPVDAATAIAAARRAFDETDWANDTGLRVRVLRQLDRPCERTATNSPS